MRNRIVLAVAMVATMAGSSNLSANDFGLSLLYGGFGGNGGYTYRNNVPTPPYFALHPPVYYGQRYYRPYGASPFAAWPQLQANPAYAPTAMPSRSPATITNSFCSAPEMSMPAVMSVGQPEIAAAPVVEPQPLMIENPFAASNSRTVSVPVDVQSR